MTKKIAIIPVLFLCITAAYLFPSSYVCYKTDTPVNIDGKLNEKEWNAVPWIELTDIIDGSKPKYASKAKLLWDGKYLYAGYEFEDPDVWATIKKETEEPRKLWYEGKEEETVKYIMMHDGFAKLFLDPDADGKNYMEFHINAFNKINDVWLGYGSKNKEKQKVEYSPDNFHLEWDCAGVKSMVYINGTLNNSADTDKGWSIEAAFPFEATGEFSSFKKIVPRAGDVWRVLIGRVYRNKPDAERTYWTWPVVGLPACHITERWGDLVFSGDSAIKK